MKKSIGKVRIKVPASTSNLGPGFDALGLALDLFNEIEVEMSRADEKNPFHLDIWIEGEGGDSLPRNGNNAVWKCMAQVFRRFKFPLQKHRFRIRFVNRLPLARGLGSSAAARLGGVLAANALCGNPLSQQDVVNLATRLEGHPDNVVPSLLGGLCASALDGKNVRYVRIDPPKDLVAAVCIPAFELSTEKARSVLPAGVSRADAVHNISRVSLLLGALSGHRYDLLKMAMEDRVHQNYRKKLIPGFDRVLANGYRAGACGIALSGAGPSIFAFCPPSRAARIGREMEKGFLKAGRKSRSLTLKFCANGSQIMYN